MSEVSTFVPVRAMALADAMDAIGEPDDSRAVRASVDAIVAAHAGLGLNADEYRRSLARAIALSVSADFDDYVGRFDDQRCMCPDCTGEAMEHG